MIYDINKKKKRYITLFLGPIEAGISVELIIRLQASNIIYTFNATHDPSLRQNRHSYNLKSHLGPNSLHLAFHLAQKRYLRGWRLQHVFALDTKS